MIAASDNKNQLYLMQQLIVCAVNVNQRKCKRIQLHIAMSVPLESQLGLFCLLWGIWLSSVGGLSWETMMRSCHE